MANRIEIELWFWRVIVIALTVFCLILAHGVNQAQDAVIKNAEFILEDKEDIVDLYGQSFSTGIILRAIADDYPPKKKLGEREWCLNRSCLTELEK